MRCVPQRPVQEMRVQAGEWRPERTGTLFCPWEGPSQTLQLGTYGLAPAEIELPSKSH